MVVYMKFREVGEGTNESIDLDKFDQYYHHLFLWDEDAKKWCLSYGFRLWIILNMV
jgi:hypothetical protein